jgi:hypothetical protein
MKVYRLQQLYEMARILNERFGFSSMRTQHLMEKTSQGLARGSHHGFGWLRIVAHGWLS